MMAWRLVSKLYETIGMKGECSVSFCRTLQTYQASKSFFEKFNERHCCQLQAGFLTATSVRPDWVRISIPGHRTQLALMRTTLGNARALNGFGGSSLFFQRHVNTKPYQIGNSDNIAPQLNRGFFVQLWVLDKKTKHSSEKRRRLKKHGNSGQVAYDDQIPLQRLAERWLSGQSTPEEESHSNRKVLHQPPPSQSATGFLKPSSREEALVFPLLARANLLISRDIEWANLVLGFEQENRYAIVDVCYPEAPVGYIREQSNVLARQFLRLRRPFVAYIIDGLGNELFRVRRPFWWITSSIYAEIDGKEVGVVHRRWHLWRRIYDLYLGNKQFAVVENPGFWNWTFTLKDIDGEVLAQIDRDWRGFGFEIFTDAGQYVIRFGSSDSVPKSGPARKIEELEVSRPLTLSERAVAVALAISLDNDYFSRHGGWGLPFVAVGE